MRRISVYTLLETFIADLGGVVHTSIHPKSEIFCEGVFQKIGKSVRFCCCCAIDSLYKSGQSSCFQTNCRAAKV